jgi:endonuclease G
MKKLSIIISFLLISINFGYQTPTVVDVEYLQPYTAQKTQTLKHKYYSVLYSQQYRQAFCSYYHLTKDMSQCTLARVDHFVPDSLIVGVHVKTTDYTNNGYDRGHLACQADMCFNKTAMEECFFLSNISPQVSGFNKGIWKKLETQCRTWSDTKGDLFIFAGGILKPGLKTISKDSVAVPEEFYKIIVHYDANLNIYETVAFLIPNQDINVYNLNDYIVSIDAIELKTNIDFLKNIPDPLENSLEQKVENGIWFLH